MLFVACCWFVVGCLLFVGRCFDFVWLLLVDDCGSLIVARRWLLLVACCSLFVNVRCVLLLFVVICVLLVTYRLWFVGLRFVVCYLLYDARPFLICACLVAY